jgi:hypothetical protein
MEVISDAQAKLGAAGLNCRKHVRRNRQRILAIGRMHELALPNRFQAALTHYVAHLVTPDLKTVIGQRREAGPDVIRARVQGSNDRLAPVLNAMQPGRAATAITIRHQLDQNGEIELSAFSFYLALEIEAAYEGMMITRARPEDSQKPGHVSGAEARGHVSTAQVLKNGRIVEGP